MAAKPTINRASTVEKLTLDEIYDLESKHPPLVGCRTNVFLNSVAPVATKARVEQISREIEQLSREVKSLLEANLAHEQHKAVR